MTIAGIIYFVVDIDKQKTFYTENFGMGVEEDTPGWVLLKSGEMEFGLHQIPSQYSSDSSGETNVKLLFDIKEDLYALRESLFNKGISIGAIQNWEGYPFLVCDGKDPEGNVFQLRKRK